MLSEDIMRPKVRRLCAAIIVSLAAANSMQCQDCGEANLRSVRAVQRAERAVARSHIAALRIKKELESADVLDSKSRIASIVLIEGKCCGFETEALAAQKLRVIQLRDQVHETAVIAMEALKPFYPDRYVNRILIPKYQKVEDSSGSSDCGYLASEIEDSAFAAEQWSQLADIAAEQAIELSSRLRRAAAKKDL
jgi:hypothetical protein